VNSAGRWTVTAGDVLALAAAVIALGASWELLERARASTDPRRPMVRAVRAEATARDLVLVAEESPETLDALAPLPAVWGVPPLDDLQGVRRVYALGGTAGPSGRTSRASARGAPSTRRAARSCGTSPRSRSRG
jgi:hypothetical protein